MSKALVATEPCGCTAWIEVLGYEDVGAYRTAAKHVKAGRTVDTVDVDEWKKTPLYCADHKGSGPPWWKRNGGNGKTPSEYAPQVGEGL